MSYLSVLNERGDTKLATWNPANETEIQVAKEKFNELVVHKGYAAYELQPNDQGVALREFNPRAERIYLAPRTVGG
jgi:hypothetical protein